jgi:phosphatidylglycerol:prolipoprotein diacylglycerol transferase
VATTHLVFEMLAYLVGGRIYWKQAATQPMPAELGDRVAILAGAIFGAFLGSKLLHIAEHLPALVAANDPALWAAGKSLVGGLLGGTLGVEVMKRYVGWTRSTGDVWVPALAAGIVIGRVGCQLSGMWDLTFGSPTTLPWAWDYGDGVGRHPAAAYEIVGVSMLAVVLMRWAAPPGARFAAFLLGYCALRFALEFVKPPFGGQAEGSLPVALYGGLTAIQWAAALGCAYFAESLRRRLTPEIAAT